MQVPSPDEGPTYNEIKDEKLQKKIIMALWDAGLQWDGKNRYELYHQK